MSRSAITDDLLTSLYEGILETPRWRTFLENLRRRTGADCVGMAFGDRSGPLQLGEVSVAPSMPAELKQRYSAEFGRFSPMPQDALRPNRVYTLDEIAGTRPPGPEDRTRSADAPALVNHARFMRVQESSGFGTWLVIANRDSDFTASDGALLSALSRHITIALATYASLERERLRGSVSQAAIDRLNFGWFMLDAAGTIVDLDTQAERFARGSAALRRTPSGRLVPAARDAEGRLALLLRQAAAGKLLKSQAIHLADEPWLDMLVKPLTGQPVANRNAPIVAVYIHGELGHSADRPERLMDLFGLSKKEAGLALLLSRGRSIAESAELLGITLETARLYSKRIYAKTGTRGQVGLVRLILASIVSLA